jgi:hypothetical protein
MFPAVWGPLIHNFLLLVAKAYPETPSAERQAAMKQYLFLTFLHLPCGDCTNHAIRLFHRHPPDLSSRQSLLQYLVDMHNMINRRLNKRSNWTVDEALETLHQTYRGDLKD